MSEVKLLMHKKVGDDWVPVEQDDFSGAAAGGAVLYDQEQSLNGLEKQQARANIGVTDVYPSGTRFVKGIYEEIGDLFLYPDADINGRPSFLSSEGWTGDNGEVVLYWNSGLTSWILSFNSFEDGVQEWINSTDTFQPPYTGWSSYGGPGIPIMSLALEEIDASLLTRYNFASNDDVDAAFATAVTLTGNQTVGGTKTFSGQSIFAGGFDCQGEAIFTGNATFQFGVTCENNLELTNQYPYNSTSAMTRALSDERYRRGSGVNGYSLIIDSGTGWTASAAIGGSSAVASGKAIYVIMTTTLNSEAYLRTAGYTPNIYAYPGHESAGSNAGILWDKQTYHGFRMGISHGSNSSPSAGCEGYIRFGMARTLTTYGPLATKGIGIKFAGGSLYGMVHDGTTLNLGAALYTTVSPYTPVNAVEIIGDGAGAFSFYINGVLGYTLTGGPTGYSGQEGTGVNLMGRNVVGGGATNFSVSIANGQFEFRYLN